MYVVLYFYLAKNTKAQSEDEASEEGISKFNIITCGFMVF